MSRRALKIGGVACGAAWTLVLALAAWPAPPAHAQDPASTLERRVKAAFLYKFASYVTWPAESFPDADTPLKIGVCGDDSLAGELTAMVPGHTVDGRAVQVIKVNAAEPLTGFHVLFVGRGELARTASLIRSLEHHPTLVVTETESGFAQGSAISFVLVEGHVRFRISVPAAERCGLALSSRLLAVALSVVRT